MIYHYTNIETLSLILHHKKIRLNRLDQLDDVSESSEYKTLDFSKYLFVSCWTEDPEENVALWHMYSKGMKGVRIGLTNPPFKMKLVNNSSIAQINIRGEKLLPFTIDECFNSDFFIPPLFSENDQFYKKVEYLNYEELQQRFERMVTKSIKQNKFSISAEVKDLAKIKHKRWSFQDESRFVLLILPPIKDLKDINASLNQIYYETPLSISYYDMDLDPIIMQEMEVIIGPNCSDGDKIIVESLLNTYSVKNKAIESKLTGQIRFNR
jgi:hypothetical protein